MTAEQSSGSPKRVVRRRTKKVDAIESADLRETGLRDSDLGKSQAMKPVIEDVFDEIRAVRAEAEGYPTERDMDFEALDAEPAPRRPRTRRAETTAERPPRRTRVARPVEAADTPIEIPIHVERPDERPVERQERAERIERIEPEAAPRQDFDADSAADNRPETVAGADSAAGSNGCCWSWTSLKRWD